MYVCIYVYLILHCVIIPKVREQSPTPHIHLEYYLRTNSHQQHPWEQETEPGHISGRFTAPIAFLLLEKHFWHRELPALEQLWSALEHQLSATSCPPCAAECSLWNTHTQGNTWLQLTVLRNLWVMGNKLSLPSELWVCLGAVVTPFHQARVWAVLVSARGWYLGMYDIHNYAICTLQFPCALVFTTATCGIWNCAFSWGSSAGYTLEQNFCCAVV